MKLFSRPKTAVLFLVAAGFLLTGPANASVTLSSTFGILYGDSSATDPLADGSLIQLIASTSGSSFSSPTAASFVSGDDQIVSSFSFDSSTTGFPGAMLDTIIFDLTGGLATGNPLLLRWFPTLTTSSIAPGAGTLYGEFRTDEFIDDSIAWFIPADSSTSNLNLLTGAVGGSLPESAGAASFVTAVPEPSTTAAIFAGFALLAMVWRTFSRGSLSAAGRKVTLPLALVLLLASHVSYSQIGAPPVAVADNVSADEDVTMTIFPLADNGNGPDTDPGGGALTIVSVTDPTNGAAVICPDGLSVIYDGELNFAGEDSFDYTIENAAGDRASATVTVTVRNTPDRPVVTGFSPQSILEDSTDNVLVIDAFDPDADEVVYGMLVLATLPNQDIVTVDGETIFSTVEKPFIFVEGTSVVIRSLEADTQLEQIIDVRPVSAPVDAVVRETDPDVLRSNAYPGRDNLVGDQESIVVFITPVNDPPVAIAATNQISQTSASLLTLFATDVDNNAAGDLEFEFTSIPEELRFTDTEGNPIEVGDRLAGRFFNARYVGTFSEETQVFSYEVVAIDPGGLRSEAGDLHPIRSRRDTALRRVGCPARVYLYPRPNRPESGLSLQPGRFRNQRSVRRSDPLESRSRCGCPGRLRFLRVGRVFRGLSGKPACARGSSRSGDSTRDVHLGGSGSLWCDGGVPTD